MFSGWNKSVLTNDINLGMLQKCGLQENIIQYSQNIFLFCEYAWKLLSFQSFIDLNLFFLIPVKSPLKTSYLLCLPYSNKYLLW